MANSLLYGFHQLKDIAGLRSVEVAPQSLTQAILLSADQYNAEVNTMINLFCDRTTAFRRRFKASGEGRLQAGDQNSRALPVKGSTYDTDLPLQKGDWAFGANAVTRAKRTVQDDNDDLARAFKADRNWIRDHILAALFYNGAGWSSTDDENGTLTVKGLANSDTVTYGRVGGAAATDTHYLAQAAAIADATNPFGTIRSELMEHPENAGSTIVSFVPSSNRAAVEALAVFRAPDDPRVSEASSLSVLTADLGVSIPGEIFGYVNGQYVAEWAALPSDYVISLAVGAQPPLAMREDTVAENQGFRPRGQRDDYPYFETQLWRMAGFGANNRVGAVVQRVGNGSYAIPTSFGSPMH